MNRQISELSADEFQQFVVALSASIIPVLRKYRVAGSVLDHYSFYSVLEAEAYKAALDGSSGQQRQ